MARLSEEGCTFVLCSSAEFHKVLVALTLLKGLVFVGVAEVVNAKLALLRMEVRLVELRLLNIHEPSLLVLQLQIAVLHFIFCQVLVVIDVVFEHVHQGLLANVHAERLNHIVVFFRFERCLNVLFFFEPIDTLLFYLLLDLSTQFQV